MSNQEPDKRNKPGLLKNSEPVFLAFAKIRKPHGLKGEVAVEMLSNFPDQFGEGDVVYIGEKKQPYTLQTIREAVKSYLLSFKECNDRNSVEHLRNLIIFIQRDALPDLTDDEYYHHDLIGMSVFDSKGNCIGEIAEIITTGANDVYVIATGQDTNNELLLPAIKSVIQEVDLVKKRVIVELPEWL